MNLPQNVAFLERYIRRMFKTELDASLRSSIGILKPEEKEVGDS